MTESTGARKPSYERETLDIVKAMLSQGNGASAISKATGLSRQAVICIGCRPKEVEE
ncbi:helix-turn-helix domain-containing protein [Palleronia sp. LCG004]|uniref:helix-turn-helix domain-containing protein n=1 Tax=Palleronia sp. LCG004 TaxID=3079304 RepID=UPI00397C0B90